MTTETIDRPDTPLEAQATQVAQFIRDNHRKPSSATNSVYSPPKIDPRDAPFRQAERDRKPAPLPSEHQIATLLESMKRARTFRHAESLFLLAGEHVYDVSALKPLREDVALDILHELARLVPDVEAEPDPEPTTTEAAAAPAVIFDAEQVEAAPTEQDFDMGHDLPAFLTTLDPMEVDADHREKRKRAAEQAEKVAAEAWRHHGE
jgi:hypothetical protein